MSGDHIVILNIDQRTVTLRQSVRESHAEERVSIKSVSSSDDEKVGLNAYHLLYYIFPSYLSEQAGKNTETGVGV